MGRHDETSGKTERARQRASSSAPVVDEGAEALLRFREAIDTRKSGEPSVLGVIAGTGFGYVRPDGIAVVPVGALAP